MDAETLKTVLGLVLALAAVYAIYRLGFGTGRRREQADRAQRPAPGGGGSRPPRSERGERDERGVDQPGGGG